MKRHSLYTCIENDRSNDVLVSDALLEDKCVTIWPDYPCLYDDPSVDFRNRDLLQKAMEAIGEQLDQTSIAKISCRFQYLSTSIIGSPCVRWNCAN